jgi:thiosulfate dehydrogenase
MKQTGRGRRSGTRLAAALAAMAGMYLLVIALSLHFLRARSRVSGVADARAERGLSIFEHTASYASDYTDAEVSCGSCHADGGHQETAVPLGGVAARYPRFRPRAGRVIGLEERIRECFVRSENGRPPADGSEVMQDLVAYLRSLPPVPEHSLAAAPAPAAQPDAAAGRALYAAQCAGCHGEHGEGRHGQWPPLWGPGSFNDGAGMNQLPRLAAFIQSNMPENRPGRLSLQEAYDLAAFIHAQSRPAMNPAYAHY